MDPADEIVSIVDEQNRETGTATRRQMRQQRLIHRCTYVFVFNSKGELFVQLRTPVKDIYPSYFDLAAGGVINAREEFDAGAARELEEELGVTGVVLQAHGIIYFEDQRSRVFGAIYSCICDGQMRYQPEEVVSGEFLAVEEVAARIERGDKITPDSIAALRHYLQSSNLQSSNR